MQPLPSRKIVFATFALRIWTDGSAAVGTFLPGDAEPVEIVDHGIDESGAAALRIQVLVAENESSASFGCSLRSRPERSRMAEMEKTGRRGCDASAIGIRF